MSEACFVLAAVFLLLLLHPYTTYPLSLMLMPKRPLRRPAPGWVHPSVAICMSAYNEERVIVAKVESLLEMAKAYGPATIHIYVDGSEDRTVELLEPYFTGPDFNFESAKKASGNVAGLCNWAEAMCTYHVVAKVVEPKIATLREAEAELKIATKVRMGGEWRGAGERGCDRPTV